MFCGNSATNGEIDYRWLGHRDGISVPCFCPPNMAVNRNILRATRQVWNAYVSGYRSGYEQACKPIYPKQFDTVDPCYSPGNLEWGLWNEWNSKQGMIDTQFLNLMAR